MDFTTIAMIALMVVAFYFLILRPQKKRQQAQQKTMNELVPGTRVLLGSGIFGTLTWVGVKQATLEIAPGNEVTILKQAIARVINEGDEYSEPEARDDEDETEDELDGSFEDSAEIVDPAAQPVVQRDTVADAAIQDGRPASDLSRDPSGDLSSDEPSTPSTSSPSTRRD